MTTRAMPLPIMAGYPPDDSTGSAAGRLQMTATSDASDPQARWPELLLDDATDEHWYWTFMWPSNYVSSPVLRVFYTASATTGGAVLASNILAQTAADATSIRADEFDVTGANTANTSAPATAYYPLKCDITLTNVDSIAAGDRAVMYLARNTALNYDTMTTDIIVLDCELRYSDA